jgi:hypothetical protein
MEGDELSRGCYCLGEVEMAGEEKKSKTSGGAPTAFFCEWGEGVVFLRFFVD